MGFILEAGLSHDDLVLIPTIEAVSGPTLRYEHAASGGGWVFLSVFESGCDTVERALEADHTVSEPTRIATFSDRTIYRVRTQSALELVPSACVEAGAFVFKIMSRKKRWLVRMYLPDRAALTVFREECRDRASRFASGSSGSRIRTTMRRTFSPISNTKFYC
jgi:hypothetical protein